MTVFMISDTHGIFMGERGSADSGLWENSAVLEEYLNGRSLDPHFQLNKVIGGRRLLTNALTNVGGQSLIGAFSKLLELENPDLATEARCAHGWDGLVALTNQTLWWRKINKIVPPWSHAGLGDEWWFWPIINTNHDPTICYFHATIFGYRMVVKYNSMADLRGQIFDPFESRIFQTH